MQNPKEVLYLCINKTKKIMKTFDIHFNDSENSNNMGFTESLDYCKDHVAQHNGTNHSHFADYKGGTVSIVDNETDETVYSERVY